MDKLYADSAEVAELLVHVGRVLRSDAGASPLTTAQWTCLRFFSHAGKDANTSSAFADFHGTSRGTASQIIKSLHEKGLLTRVRSRQDARSHVFKLSALGWEMLDQDPLQSLVSAVDQLGSKNREQLQKLCYSLLENVGQIRNKRFFGTCSHCTHYASHSGSQARSYCNFDQKDLAPDTLGNWCASFSLS
ncbi:MAG: MarR family transcriptional regulator [Gammaproteobacteria bacterium]|nr:MarR family transcriptional regulator [Gammaproteobacteria bacterium]